MRAKTSIIPVKQPIGSGRIGREANRGIMSFLYNYVR